MWLAITCESGMKLKSHERVLSTASPTAACSPAAAGAATAATPGCGGAAATSTASAARGAGAALASAAAGCAGVTLSPAAARSAGAGAALAAAPATARYFRGPAAARRAGASNCGRSWRRILNWTDKSRWRTSRLRSPRSHRSWILLKGTDKRVRLLPLSRSPRPSRLLRTRDVRARFR